MLRTQKGIYIYIYIYESKYGLKFDCRILIHIYFHTVLSEKQMPNTISHNI